VGENQRLIFAIYNYRRMAEAHARSVPSDAQGGCRHSGYYTGLGLYTRESQTLRYVLVCDDCGEEMEEISTQDYAPEPALAVT
jgi:hypothetical protein